MARRAVAEPVYEAADLFRRRCLVEGRSFLWPEHHVWKPETISVLREAFIGNPDTGKRTFFEKWRDQLADLPEEVYRVATDAVAFYYLHPSNIGRERKLADVRMVVGWKLEQEWPDTEPLEEAYSVGVGHAGTLYNTRRPEQVDFFLQFFSEVLSNGIDSTDAEACKSLADGMRERVHQSGPARHILLHLLFPDHFERIAADGHKQKIVETFGNRAGAANDRDDALLNIRHSLAEEYGRGDLDFYDEDIKSLWLEGAENSSEKVPSAERYAAALHAARTSGALHNNYLKMLQFHYSRPRHTVTATQLSRAVDYRNYNSANLHYGNLGKIIGEKLGWGVEQRSGVLQTFEKPEDEWHWIMRPEVAQALEQLGWVGDDEEAVSLSNRGPLNTILYGPPGTGKTYLTQKRALDILEPDSTEVSDEEARRRFREYLNDGRIEFVTFHPSYSYEEFVEGFRYNENKGVPTRHDGVFKRLCVHAEQEQEEGSHVLIIDEINRGNLSRIFGELITLLEEDKRSGAENKLSARLPYSGEAFAVPSNLYVIGTMNTADRSIALLDTALRRRFQFEEMRPDAGVIREVLGANLVERAEHIELVCGVFETINKRVAVLLDRDHQIGHSYFLDADSIEGLCHALYHRVFPLLQEYFYNDQERLREVLGAYDSENKRGFVRRMEEYRSAFEESVADEDLPWEFVEYPDEELAEALQNTFHLHTNE